MANIVEFILKMKDLMSGPFAKATEKGAGLQKVLSSVDDQAKKTADTVVHSNERMADSFDKVEEKASKYNRGLSSILSGAKALLPVLSIAGAAMGIGSMVSDGMQADKQRTSLQVLAGDKPGAQLYGGLTKFATDTVFGSEVYGNAQTMLGNGIDSKEVLTDMKMLGDVSMGDKEKLNSLSLAFAQIKGNGRLMGQDLLQLINAGFNPLQVMVEKTGKSMGTLRQMMEKGQIPFQAVQMAFEDATGPAGKFHEMLQKIADTPFGKFENLKGSIEQFGIKIGNALLPLAGGVLDAALNGLGKLQDMLASIYHWYMRNKDVIDLVVVSLSAAIAAYALYANWTSIISTVTKAWTSVQLLLNAALNANPIGLVIAAVAALVAGVIYAWNKFEGFRKFFFSLWETIKQVFSNIVDIFKSTFAPIIDAITALREGRWLDAGKAILALNPVATAARFANALMDGGLTKGISDAWQRGQLKGAQSWKASQTKENGQKSTGQPSGANHAASEYEKLFGASSGKSGKNSAGKVGSDISSGGPRTININFNREFIHQLAVNSYNVREGIGELESIIEENLKRVLLSAAQAT